MATGSYDANGIWNYGEDDNIALFSDTLNKLADSTSDAFTADRSRLSTLEAGSLAGLIPVKPVSVAVAGGTAAVNTLGVVTFTNATSISLNNVFSSSYENYRIIINVDTPSATSALAARLRASGTDDTGANYLRSRFVIRANNSTATDGDTGGGAMVFTNMYIGDNHLYGLSIDMMKPFTATRTTCNGLSTNSDSVTKGFSIVGVQHLLSTSYDGLTLFPTAGNISGRAQVFGYND